MLKLSLLSTLTLSRDGEEVALPASRKTRALLASLAASGRARRKPIADLEC